MGKTPAVCLQPAQGRLCLDSTAQLSEKPRLGKKLETTGEGVFCCSPQTRIASGEMCPRYDEGASGQTIYAYVGGNPIFYRDPTGHLAILAVPYAPAIVGAVAAGMAAITVAWASIHDFDDDEEEYVPKPKPRPKPQPKPKNCPAGTKPIDQMGWSKDKVHGIKDGLGLGATDWTGVAPDGSIVVTGPNGDAVTAGHESDY